MKLPKNKKLKSFWLIILLALPVLASACSNLDVDNQTFKVLDATSWNSNGQGVKYTTLANSPISLSEGIYGSSFNNGNYLLIYGSLFNDATRNFLYGPNGNLNFGTNNTVTEQDFSSSPFLNRFFLPNNSLGGGNLLPFNVSLLMFIDIPPFNPDASAINGLEGRDGPFSQYSDNEVLREFNDPSKGLNQVFTLETLPPEARVKIGNFKRNDEQAIAYRYFVEYLQIIRPNVNSQLDQNGLIAFKSDKAPKGFSLGDVDNLYSQLVDYYQNP